MYRDVFDRIIAEDREFMDPDANFDLPGFGCSNSAYDEVQLAPVCSLNIHSSGQNYVV